MNDYKLEYQILEWHSLENLTQFLNTMVNDGWRVENHKLSAGDDKSGWTIFAKTIILRKPLLERQIIVGEVYRILNNVLEAGSVQARDFDAAIKNAVRLPTDEAK